MKKLITSFTIVSLLAVTSVAFAITRPVHLNSFANQQSQNAVVTATAQLNASGTPEIVTQTVVTETQVQSLTLLQNEAANISSTIATDETQYANLETEIAAAQNVAQTGQPVQITPVVTP